MADSMSNLQPIFSHKKKVPHVCGYATGAVHISKDKGREDVVFPEILAHRRPHWSNSRKEYPHVHLTYLIFISDRCGTGR